MRCFFSFQAVPCWSPISASAIYACMHMHGVTELKTETGHSEKIYEKRDCLKITSKDFRWVKKSRASRSTKVELVRLNCDMRLMENAEKDTIRTLSITSGWSKSWPPLSRKPHGICRASRCNVTSICWKRAISAPLLRYTSSLGSKEHRIKLWKFAFYWKSHNREWWERKRKLRNGLGEATKEDWATSGWIARDALEMFRRKQSWGDTKMIL